MTFTFYWKQEEKQRQKSGMDVKLEKKKRITKCVGRLEPIKIYFMYLLAFVVVYYQVHENGIMKAEAE